MATESPVAQHSVAEEILENNRGRIPAMFRRKCNLMSKDAFSFFRGTDHLFAKNWDRLAPPDVGPAVLLCGDLHLENFGAYRTDDGDYLYDIDDFDESIVGPCTLDLVRCTASVLLAAQNWKYTPVQALRTLLAFLDRYRTTVEKAVKTGHLGEVALGTARGPIWHLLKRPARDDRMAFLSRFTETKDDSLRLERTSGRFRPLEHDLEQKIRKAIERYGKDKEKRKSYEVVDVAFRVAGIGSLGLERYAILVRGAGPGKEWLLDLKEVGCPSLLGCAGGAVQLEDGGSNARRAVLAQRQLQSRPTAKLEVVEVGKHPLRLRELIPEENRTGLEQLRKRPRRLRRAVALAGRLTAWAHVRGSRTGGEDRSAQLADWADGPGLDAVIASAVRYAEQTRRDYKAFLKAYKDGFFPKSDD